MAPLPSTCRQCQTPGGHAEQENINSKLVHGQKYHRVAHNDWINRMESCLTTEGSILCASLPLTNIITSALVITSQIPSQAITMNSKPAVISFWIISGQATKRELISGIGYRVSGISLWLFVFGIPIGINKQNVGNSRLYSEGWLAPGQQLAEPTFIGCFLPQWVRG